MALIDLVRRNLISAEEAQSRTNTPNLFGTQPGTDGKTAVRPGGLPNRPANLRT
jgi:hypothetical protein